ncbi:MAG: hypothetical protein WA830_13050 [Candidatus Sulfotelmatobacter sp.]
MDQARSCLSAPLIPVPQKSYFKICGSDRAINRASVVVVLHRSYTGSVVAVLHRSCTALVAVVLPHLP